MDDADNIIYGLNLFNEKADKLFRLSFVKTMFETKTGVSFSGKRKSKLVSGLDMIDIT